MPKKKILITGCKWMLAYDFIRTQSDAFIIIATDRDECDITSFESIMQYIASYEPDLILNCAAYTAVDDAEDIGMKIAFDVNTLWVKNLAKASSVFGIDFITISTDYVFDGSKSEGYLPDDICNPISIYGMSKYLGEKLALDENPRTIVLRTSWLYGWNPYGSSEWVFKNFVNTMLKLSETRSEIAVVNDQHGIPTSCRDLSQAIARIISSYDTYAWRRIHLSSSCREGSITWADFAREIFVLKWREVQIIDCSSSEYQTKAKRPEWSILVNNSDNVLPDWKIGLTRYLGI